MRLLNTHDLQFEEFFDSDIPEYAILSHRWGEKEVSFRQMSKGTALRGPGLWKIEDCYSLAAQNHLQWVWIDTCCIDKKSSAELSEAINSMFRWYQNALHCYVYLSDVSCESRPRRGSQTYPAFKEAFIKSQWFTRGWTLQELLAPLMVYFFDGDWKIIGERHELLDEIVEATNIRKACLTDTGYELACVAEKMSWLSHRRTSRIEDMSYCMLGLFNINLPLLYGEGEKAFTRLQLEILRKSQDESIFVFDQEDVGHFDRADDNSVLARSPVQFRKSHNVRRSFPNMQIRYGWEPLGSLELYTVASKDRPPYSITNKGLKFRIPPQISNMMLNRMVAQAPLLCYRLVGGFDSVKEGCSLRLQRWHGDVWCISRSVQKKPKDALDNDDDDDNDGDDDNYNKYKDDDILLSENAKWPAIYLHIDQ